MYLIQRFMRVFFDLLYHPFAFTYDFVAAAVSFGRWNDWVQSVIPFVSGTRILELGHGPGHLQLALTTRGLDSVAMDESAPMGRIAKRRLGNSHKLARAVTQKIPFAFETFDSVISTFPSEYIFDPQTSTETYRVLRSGGKLIVLPVAFPTSGFLKWLYKVTGESPAALDELLKERFKQPFIQAGFSVELKTIELKSSTLLIILATK
ncbi:demethylmenaquinone methyltransferase / 2-methoxy-6-polyprenyl-1,4-benzoquinol methylase [Anaerolineales bacterium]|nr:demethylmenaquinone methyltransferase / 2-methoxy-6-polyprenyl-1,4-benzoquinol methylase [Anaerolineales bacterium]